MHIVTTDLWKVVVVLVGVQGPRHTFVRLGVTGSIFMRSVATESTLITSICVFSIFGHCELISIFLGKGRASIYRHTMQILSIVSNQLLLVSPTSSTCFNTNNINRTVAHWVLEKSWAPKNKVNAHSYKLKSCKLLTTTTSEALYTVVFIPCMCTENLWVLASIHENNE